jgi:hypothetical protein
MSLTHSFKIGDKVRMISAWEDSDPVGEVGTVIDVYNDNHILVDIVGAPRQASRFILVKQAVPKKGLGVLIALQEELANG